MYTGAFDGMLEKIAGRRNIKKNEPMKFHTTFKTGGPVDFLVSPADMDSLEGVIGLCRESEVPFHIIGNGSNLIVNDSGISGVAVMISDNLSGYEVNGCDIDAEAGASLSDIADIACDNSLGGFEFASGIPGTVGGAICMNAGAYGGQMSDVLVSVRLLDENGRNLIIDNLHDCFGYRSSCFQGRKIAITGAVLELKKASKNEIISRMSELAAERSRNQPLDFPSAGSVFKRPEGGHYVWKLIEGCGLRGFQTGGARVSEKHCNFIINTGGATSSDIIELIDIICDKVADKYGVRLETEIKIIGGNATSEKPQTAKG